ncbi:hypothetical protein [Streptomyces hydrogenans]|uniref:hypothetical protein n=1 Tax=Streptomyces hydrogenans TaxID=1873719 RepID=UPI0038291863
MNAKRIKAAEGVVLAALVGSDSSAAGIAAALEAACLLQSPESAAELTRLRSLMNSQPPELTEEQRDALSDAGNRALNDHYHEDLCHCREWPESCATRNYFPGMWDTAAFDIGIGAVLGLWESMRTNAAAARVAELEAERHSTNEALDDAVAALRVQRDRIAELEAALAPQPRPDHHRTHPMDESGIYPHGTAVRVQTARPRENTTTRTTPGSAL